MNKAAAALAATLLLGFTGTAFAFGAIAVDDQRGSKDPGYGYAIGYSTEAAAKANALKFCKQHGNDNCKVVGWFKQCGAYASSKRYYGYGWGATKAVAAKKALEMCGNKNCEVHVAKCE